MKILTFDVEEWFHLLENQKSNSVSNWNNYPGRLEVGINKILDQLLAHNIKSTFFCLGWIADKYPKIIKRIAAEGHQVGSHTYMHKLATHQSHKEFANDLKRSIDSLQQIIGAKIISFRAPGFSIKKSNLWVFEKLIENGIEIDSSIVTSNIHLYGGIPQLDIAKPFLLNVNGSLLKEFPINSKKISVLKFVYSGGGYFRFFPYEMIKAWTRGSNYVMAYFHYRDFDADQPILQGIDLFKKFRSYYGIRSAYPKFLHYLKDFKFINIEKANKELDWRNINKVDLKEISHL